MKLPRFRFSLALLISWVLLTGLFAVVLCQIPPLGFSWSDTDSVIAYTDKLGVRRDPRGFPFAVTETVYLVVGANLKPVVISKQPVNTLESKTKYYPWNIAVDLPLWACTALLLCWIGKKFISLFRPKAEERHGA